jgi:hypothetical protein
MQVVPLHNDGRHELQVWAFRLHRPATLLAAVPLFQTSESEDPYASSGGGGGNGGGGMTERESEMLEGDMDAGGEQMRISVCESADRDVLLIHGEPTAGRQFGSSEVGLYKLISGDP